MVELSCEFNGSDHWRHLQQVHGKPEVEVVDVSGHSPIQSWLVGDDTAGTHDVAADGATLVHLPDSISEVTSGIINDGCRECTSRICGSKDQWSQRSPVRGVH